MSLRDQLMAVKAEHGRLTPAAVVDAARPKSHPLHERFEWDNRVAGEAWRRVQASELIRSVRVVYREGDDESPSRSVRAFHAVRDEEGHGYEAAEDVAADPIKRAIVLRDMEREWHQMHRRYGDFEEFVKLVADDLGLGEAG
jgi:hypothetical protein